MFKIESYLPMELTRDARASKIRLRRFLVLLLSLAAHLFLVFFINSQVGLIHELMPSEPSQSHAMNIHVVVPENDTITPVTNPNNIDIRTQTIPTKPPESLPSPAELLPDIPRPIIEIMVPPTPYYFRTNTLTVKPQVSSDIPQDLGTLLTADLPGTAIFRLQINEHGEIDQIIVDESSFSEADQRTVVEAFQKMKFEPGKIDDKSVKSEMRIEIVVEKPIPIFYP
jgi:TonB family protein